MFWLIGYLLIGMGMYFAIVHFELQSDRDNEECGWIILFWPVVYLLGAIDFIDWIGRKLRE